MYRTITTNAIVLRRERYGEIHKGPLPSHRRIWASSRQPHTAHSRWRVRLRLGSEPFTWSRVQLYHNPVKKSYKLTEADIQSSFDGLQHDLGRLSAACLWVEMIQKSYGAGVFPEACIDSFLESLQLLENADQTRTLYMKILFCGGSLSGRRSARHDALRAMRRSPRRSQDRLLLHPFSFTLLRRLRERNGHCAPGRRSALSGSDGWSLTRPCAEVRLESTALAALERGMVGMVESVLEGGLSSLQWVGADR